MAGLDELVVQQIPNEHEEHYIQIDFKNHNIILTIRKEDDKNKIHMTNAFCNMIINSCKIKHLDSKHLVDSLAKTIMSSNDIKKTLFPVFENESKESLNLFEELMDVKLSDDNLNKLINETKDEMTRMGYLQDKDCFLDAFHQYRTSCRVFLNCLKEFNKRHPGKKPDMISKRERESHDEISKLMSETFDR